MVTIAAPWNDGSGLDPAVRRTVLERLQRAECADQATGRLVRLLADWRMPGTGIYAVYPSNRLVTPRVRACVDHLARHLRVALADGVDNLPLGA